MKRASLALLTLSFVAASAWSLSALVGAASPSALASQPDVRTIGCELDRAEAPPEADARALPPGHPPIPGQRQLPPGHPPILVGRPAPSVGPPPAPFGSARAALRRAGAPDDLTAGWLRPGQSDPAPQVPGGGASGARASVPDGAGQIRATRTTRGDASTTSISVPSGARSRAPRSGTEPASAMQRPATVV